MIDPKDVKMTAMRGKGPGGQHRNKTSSCIRAVHVPTGIEVVIDGRKQAQNKREALAELERRVAALKDDKRAKMKKALRDHAIKHTETIRTYNFDRGTVKDHRTGRVASLKDVLGKGKIELLGRPTSARPPIEEIL